MELEDVSLIAWLQKHQMKTESGQDFDLKNHLFLYDFLCDWSPLIVSKKAAQIGFTTAAFFKLAYAVGKRGMEAIYTAPTSDDVKIMVGGKFNRIIRQNPALQTLIKDHDSIEQKVIGRNVVNFRGTWTEREAISHASDLNVHDEYDRSKQEVLETYSSRLQHSKYGWQWIFSNPSTGGAGVDRYWKLSDQKEWYVTCDECGEAQQITWPESVDTERKIFACKGCGGDITSTRRKGVWKATAKGAWSGYHISLLICPWVSAEKIIELAETKSPEYFANYVLGEPFIGTGNTITEDLFRYVATVNGQERTIIGCDSGIKKHYVMGNAEGVYYHGVTEDWNDIRKLMRRDEQTVLIVDAMPDITGPRALREEFPGRVFLVHYAKDRKTMKVIRYGEGDEYGNVVADRNRLLQLVIDEMAEGRIQFNGTEHDWRPYKAHWQTMYRVNDTDALGQPTFSWETSNGQDHWAHATAYWRIGMDRFGTTGGDVLGPEGTLPFKTGVKIDLQGRVPNPLTYAQGPKDYDWRDI